MAVDTAQKRASAMYPLCPWRQTIPLPGTITQPDRQQLAYVYSGISAGVLTIFAPAPTQSWVWDLYRKH